MADDLSKYTRIVNTVIEALVSGDFSKREYKIVLAVIRKTYGYHKKDDRIALSQLAEMTGITRTHCCKTVNDLVAKKVLLKQAQLNGQVIGLNKKPSEWKCAQNSHSKKSSVPVLSQSVPVLSQSVPETGTKLCPKQAPQKKKETIQKKIDKRKLQGGKPPVPTKQTWDAYATTYQQRYGVDPVRNATINGQLANFVKRIGQAEAPHVASFYVQHNGRYYVQQGHQVGIMLKDAEKLRTEWATNTQITEAKSRQTDKTQTNANTFRKLLDEVDDEGKQITH